MQQHNNNCPYCGSGDVVQTNEQDIYYDEVYVEYECEECTAIWNRHYYYSDTQITKKGKDYE